MDKKTIKCAIEALNSRIKKLEKFIDWKMELYNEHLKILKENKEEVNNTIGDFGVVTKTNKSTSEIIVAKSKTDLDKAIPKLKDYKRAKNNLEKYL